MKSPSFETLFLICEAMGGLNLGRGAAGRTKPRTETEPVSVGVKTDLGLLGPKIAAPVPLISLTA